MAKANKTKAAASEAVQDVQEPQGMGQDTQAQEAASEAVQGPGIDHTGQPDTVQDLAELSEGLLTGYAVTGCDALNLREGPSLDARVVAVIPRDAGVFAEEGPEGGWLRVCTGWLEGYMMAKYLKPLPWPVLPHGAG